jgi:hypothetical protein
MNLSHITLTIINGQPGQPPMVRADGELTGNTDAAMVARAMLASAAYLFAQGQPVAFGQEVPRELLK